MIQPSFGASGLESVARAALPFAFATAGMAVVVIVGGIDLSVASIMAVCAVTAAFLMERMASVPALFIVLGAGLAMGLINGALIVLTRVPDIVVTLAMLFVWEGEGFARKEVWQRADCAIRRTHYPPLDQILALSYSFCYSHLLYFPFVYEYNLESHLLLSIWTHRCTEKQRDEGKPPKKK